jgi:hypothetical protein
LLRPLYILILAKGRFAGTFNRVILPGIAVADYGLKAPLFDCPYHLRRKRHFGCGKDKLFVQIHRPGEITAWGDTGDGVAFHLTLTWVSLLSIITLEIL